MHPSPAEHPLHSTGTHSGSRAGFGPRARWANRLRTLSPAPRPSDRPPPLPLALPRSPRLDRDHAERPATFSGYRDPIELSSSPPSECPASTGLLIFNASVTASTSSPSRSAP